MSEREDLARRLADMVGGGKAEAFLDGLLGGQSAGRQEEMLSRVSEMVAKQKKPEKGVPWHRKVIEDKTYVPLADVIDLLRVNDVLPGVRRGLERLDG